MAKKRTMNEYRQTKDSHYTNPWKIGPAIGSDGEVKSEHVYSNTKLSLYEQLVLLRKKYPNDQEFGYHVAKELL